MQELFKGKKVLVTGGTGSIGQVIVREILRYNPEVVRILDIDETREFEMKQQLKDYSNLRFLIGSVRDKERLSRAMENIDVVFHFASLKHVLACEYNPFEAVKTNVIGTQNLIDAVLEEENVDRVVFTSSDKAANPCNVMGATKLLAERLITAANYYKGWRKTAFCSVRFGNVLGSRGSIIPLFKDQIRNGGPITLTDERMTRFVMPMSQTSRVLFKAAEMARGGEIFVLKMKSVRTADLAKVMIEELCGREADNIAIKVVGRQPGEKLFEEIMTPDEVEHALETEDMFIVLPEITEEMLLELPEIARDSRVRKSRYPNAKLAKLRGYRSDDVKALSKKEIRDMLRQEDLF
jgi:UDP-N-acetylglucosamine 4,6-dehydratase